MLNLKTFPAILFLLVTCGLTVAAEAKETTTLDLNGKNVKREEISQSFIGLTSTKLFYTLADQQMVVVIHLDNTNKEFPATGKVQSFEKGVTAEDLAKWVNNQHSDGLFADAPEPRVSFNIPAEACKTVESKLAGKTSANDMMYDQHAVVFKINETNVNEQLKLKEFKDQAKVYVLAK
jgi:hypothetical protein